MQHKVAKLFLVISLLALILIVSSTNSYPYPELLSEQEGKYYVLYVGVLENDHMRNPELFRKVRGKEVAGAKLMWSLEDAQNEYPKLELQKAPVYLIFDSKGMVLKTENEQEAAVFLFGGDG